MSNFLANSKNQPEKGRSQHTHTHLTTAHIRHRIFMYVNCGMCSGGSAFVRDSFKLNYWWKHLCLWLCGCGGEFCRRQKYANATQKVMCTKIGYIYALWKWNFLREFRFDFIDDNYIEVGWYSDGVKRILRVYLAWQRGVVCVKDDGLCFFPLIPLTDPLYTWWAQACKRHRRKVIIGLVCTRRRRIMMERRQTLSVEHTNTQCNPTASQFVFPPNVCKKSLTI